ncbi:MAG: hypothetical protein U9Q58_07635 [Pseudomonadota bacterium]|nr:hypothetical protein [Pseudomonadota bacterium]
MIKTQTILDAQLQKLLAKHPALKDLVVKTAADYPDSHPVNDYDWLAAFIDKCWRATYHAKNGPKKSRFIYTPNYLKWLLDTPAIDKRLTTVISDKAGQILGITYGMNKTLNLGGENLKVVVQTGISVHPEHTKKGIAQLVYLSCHAFAIETGYDGTIGWFDAQNNEKGHTLNIFRRTDPFLEVDVGSFFAKIFDYKKAVAVNKFNFLQKTFLKLVSGVPQAGNRGGFKTELIATSDNLDEIAAFINSGARCDLQDAQSPGHYHYTKAELTRLLLYQSPTHSKENPALKTTATLLTDNHGTIQGLLHGYNIPVEEKSTGNIFFIDNILTTKTIPTKAKTDFIKNSLAIIAKEQDVYGALVVDNTCSLKSLTYRLFSPVLSQDLLPKKQLLVRGILSYTENFDKALDAVEKIYVDHK